MLGPVIWPETNALRNIPTISIARAENFAGFMLKEEFERNNSVAFANPSLTNQRLKLFWIGVGKEDGLYPVISEYLQVLDEKKIKHETFISEGGHTWMNCKLYLTTIAQKLFK